MALHKYICGKTTLVLPRENGGTITLSEGQVVVGPHYAKFVGYGLVPYAEPRPYAPPSPPKAVEAPKAPVKPAPVATPVVAPPKPVVKAPAPSPVPPKVVPPPAPAIKPSEALASIKKAEPTPPPAPKEEGESDSLPKNTGELRGKSKRELADMAKELGLDNTGSKEALVKRIADELGLA